MYSLASKLKGEKIEPSTTFEWLIHVESFPHHYISIMIHDEYELRSLHVKLLWIQNPLDHNSPFEFFINTKCDVDLV
jgi:hypothetical protein